MSTDIDFLKRAVEDVILDPKYAGVLAILKAARNGAVYGAKIRFPHALVMVFMFRSGTLQEKIALILKATRTHAQNLSKFAIIYKTTMLLLKNYGATPGKEGPFDTFFSGLLGGYIVFGRPSRSGKISSVNQQIVIYIFARVVLALAKLSVRPQTGIIKSQDLSDAINNRAWPVFAAMSWASVMYVFRWYPDTVPGGLKSSMNYIYVQSDTWDSLRTLVWHNK